ncbi:MAG: hypothetical protein IKB78_09195 [Clostridia bacterium]|nr:hypothetical protein [Clostridia bacterium]
MDALILTCGTGGGHNTAAQALQEELLRRGHSAQVLNPYRLKSDKLADFIDHSYIRMAKSAPKLFGGLYQIGDKFRKFPSRSPVYHLNGGMTETFAAYLQRHPVDVILMTHFFGAHILTQMKSKGLTAPPQIMVATDYTCIPLMEEIDCDAYITPAVDLHEEYLQRGIPADRLHPLGIPVRSAFTAPMSKAEARAALHLSPDGRYALVAGGSMGAGDLDKLLTELYRAAQAENTRLIVICGSNTQLYDRLQQQYGEQLILVGRTEQMATYMRACDMLFTKPGGLTSTEAAVVGIPLVHITPIPGCETRNRAYFETHGMSLAARMPAEAVDALRSLNEPALCQQMVEQQHACINAGAASDICDLAEMLAAHQR